MAKKATKVKLPMGVFRLPHTVLAAFREICWATMELGP